MSSHRVHITPIKRSRRLLNSVFKFNPSSKLYNVVIKRGGDKSKYFYLHQILTILKNYIRTNGLYDKKNPSTILCCPELEEAFGRKSLHITEIRKMVLKHVTRVRRDLLLLANDPDHSLGG